MKRFVKFTTSEGAVFINPLCIVEFQSAGEARASLTVEGRRRKVIVECSDDEVAHQIQLALGNNEDSY